MALTGLHVLCAFSGKPNDPNAQQSLLRDPQWSETLNAPGTTAQSVKASNAMSAIFRIRSGLDAFVAVGPQPNASALSGSEGSARMFVEAEVDYDIYVKGGDRLAWVAA